MRILLLGIFDVAATWANVLVRGVSHHVHETEADSDAKRATPFGGYDNNSSS